MNKIYECEGHTGETSSASLSIAENLLATCGQDQCVKIWTTKDNIATLKTKFDTISLSECVHFSHDGLRLAYGNSSGAIKLVDVQSGKDLRTLSGHRSRVLCICQSPKSAYTWASGSFDTSFILWDIRRHPASVATFRQHSKAVTALQFSPHGSWLSSGAEDCKVKILDIAARGESLLAEFVGHSGPISDVQFHPSEYLLASASSDKTVRFWDLDTHECVTQSEPTSSVIRKLRFSPDGSALLTTAESDVRVIGWEPFSLLGRIALPPLVSVLDCSVTDDGLRIAMSKSDLVVLYDVHISTILDPSSSPVSSPIDDCHESELVEQLGLASLTDSLDLSSLSARSKKIRRSFHSPPSESKPPHSIDPSPMLLPMPIRRRHHSGGRSTRPVEIPTGIPVHLPTEPNEAEVFQKRDKLPRSQPDSPSHSPPHMLLCPVNQEQLALTVVPTSAIPKSKSSRKVGKSLHGKVTLSRTNSTPKLTSVCQKNKPKKAEIVAVQSLGVPGRKVEKVSPLPRPSMVPSVFRSPCKPALDSSFIDPAEFLPSMLSSRSPVAFPSPSTSLVGSERDCLDGIIKQSQTMHVVLQHRVNAVAHLKHTWATGGLRRAVDVTLQTNDQTLLVELLNALNSRSNLWSLHLCSILLPELAKLLHSRHDVYIQTAVRSLKLIVDGFGDIINYGIMTNPPSIGVDVTKEERLNKCRLCYTHLAAIGSLTPKFGRHSQTFRDIGVMMQKFSNSVPS